MQAKAPASTLKLVYVKSVNMLEGLTKEGATNTLRITSDHVEEIDVAGLAGPISRI